MPGQDKFRGLAGAELGTTKGRSQGYVTEGNCRSPRLFAAHLAYTKSR